MDPQEERSYIAFISYRHRPLDKQAAELIQKKIERYKVPKEYQAKIGSNHLGHVFRDEDELPAASSLSGSITYALDHSQYLIVICTPDLPLSKWCELEIQYFIKTHDRDHVLAVLVDGEPEESFSPYLRYEFDPSGQVVAEVEPLAANIAGKNHTIDKKKFKKEIVRIYAALLGCPFDALWQREKRYRTNRLLAIGSAAFLVMAAFLGVVIKNNLQIRQQNRELEYQKSSILVSTGEQLLESHDIQNAIDSAKQAMQNGDTMPYDLRSQALLAEALGAYETSYYRQEFLLEQTSLITDVVVSEEGNIITADQFGMVRCYDDTGHQILWTISSQAKGHETFDAAINTKLKVNHAASLLYCINGNNVKAVSLADGSQVWEAYSPITNYFFVLSPDESLVAVINYETYSHQELLILSADTGEELHHFPIELTDYDLCQSFHANPIHQGAFSGNGQYFMLVTEHESKTSYTDHHHEGVLFDLNVDSRETIFTTPLKDDYNNAVLTVHVSDDGSQMYIAYYDGDEEKLYRCFYRRHAANYDYYENEISSYVERGTDALENMIYVPSHVKGDLILTVFHNQLFIDDWKNEEGLWISETDGYILSASFSDATPGAVHLLRSTGIEYLVIPGESSAWLEVDDPVLLSFGYLTDNEWGFLYIDKESPNKLMRFSENTDPHCEVVELSQLDLNAYGTFAFLSPSSERLFVLAPSHDEPWLMEVYSTADWSLVAKQTFSAITEAYSPQAIPLDEESFMIGFRVYHIDGSISYMEGYDENGIAENRYLFSTVRGVMKDGKVLSVLGTTLYPPEEYRINPEAFDSFASYKGYVDGAKNEQMLRIDSDKIYVLGENGYLITYGHEVTKDDDGMYEAAETDPVFYLWDVANDAFISIPDDCPNDLMRKVVAAKESPFFAVADSEGGVRIYSIEEKTSTLLSDIYSTGPVHTMVFFHEDQYLAVHTYTGRLDVYDIQSGTLLFSEEISLFSGGPSSFSEIQIYETQDGRFLFIGKYRSDNYGQCIVMDASTWTVTATIRQTYGYISQTNEVLVLRGADLCRYPLYTKDDLLNWE